MPQFLNRTEIVAKVKSEMAAKKLNQKQMAERLGVSEGYFSDFVKEKRGVGPSLLTALGYDLTPHYRRAKQNGAGGAS